MLYDLGVFKSISFEPNIKTISIGNLSVGGTGKSPHTEYITSLLLSTRKKEEGIAILSRGYKRKTKGFVLADNHSTVSDIGDEPMQMKSKFTDVAIAVDENRVHGIKQLQSKVSHLQVVLLDDAYQHRRLSPGLSILLTPVDRLYTKDFPMPMGRLRESHKESRRADIIIVTKGHKTITPIEKRVIKADLSPETYQQVYFSYIQYQSIVPLHNREFKHSLNKKTSVLLFTGIASDEHLYYHVKLKSRNFKHLAFKDHHTFKRSDIVKIKKAFDLLYGPVKILLTTEKDAIRIKNSKIAADLLDLPLYYIPINIGFDTQDQEALNQQILNYVRSN